MNQGKYKERTKKKHTIQPAAASQSALKSENDEEQTQQSAVNNIDPPVTSSETVKKKRTNAIEALKIRNAKRKEQEQKKKNRYTLGQIGLTAGFITAAKGAGKACASIAASPLLQFVGYGIAIASIGYMIWTFFN